MPIDAADIARIRFVTSRYRHLQGLRHLVWIGQLLAFLWLSGHIVRPHGALDSWEEVRSLLLLITPIGLANIGDVWLQRYYSRRFGGVRNPALWRRDSVAGLLLFLGATWLDSRVVRDGGPSTTLIAVGLISLHAVISDWPWRAHYLLPTAVSVVATAMMLPLSEMSFVITLCAVCVAAWLDHRLLVRTLPPSPDACADTPVAEGPWVPPTVVRSVLGLRSSPDGNRDSPERAGCPDDFARR